MDLNTAEKPYHSLRLDSYISTLQPDISRAQLQRLIKNGKVRVDGQVQQKNGFMVKESMSVQIDYDFNKKIRLEDPDITVLYEDKDCVVIDKPLGILTHSKGVFNPESSVASWLANRPNFSFPAVGPTDNPRAGIVHRLDRATSGVMIAAKNQAALTHLQKQFQDRKAKKTYIARVAGEITPSEALIDVPIERNPKMPQRFRVGHNGKSAQTNYKVMQTVTQNSEIDSVVELKPYTGRTHQLRVHLEYIKHPIVGDTFYDGRPAERLFLHAHQLEITLPNRERVIFTSNTPEIFFKPDL